jgi:hypothetical protein
MLTRNELRFLTALLGLAFAAPALAAQTFADLDAPLASSARFLPLPHSQNTSALPLRPSVSPTPLRLPLAASARPLPLSTPFSAQVASVNLANASIPVHVASASESTSAFSSSLAESTLNYVPVVACSAAESFDVVACFPDYPLNLTSWTNSFDPLVGNSFLSPAARKEHFHWGPALWQSLEFLVTEHAFRLATDPYARHLLVHRPLWHDYWASLNDFHMNRWGDGDSFIVNYIGHPMQGAVTGNIFLQNDPQGRSASFGKSSAYWHSRLKAWVWAAAYSTYFEIGPVLSETALGNEGGYTYVPGCGWYLQCHPIPGKHYKPPNNNTGWVDFVITPTLGIGWIVLEDAIEREIVDRIAKDSHADKYKLMRSALAPSKTMANVLAGKFPWYRYPTENSVAAAFGAPLHPLVVLPAWKDAPRWSTGVHFISVDLPMDRQGCNACRQFASGAGFDFSYRGSRYVYFDSEANFFPGSGSWGSRGSAQQVLAGLKIGYTSRSWGIFSQVRPGFLHYEKTLQPGSATIYTDSTRFALDLGGSFEYYASTRSTLRFRVGTMLVHYLTGRPDPLQPPVTVLSDQYYTLQGNLYLSSGYVFRF